VKVERRKHHLQQKMSGQINSPQSRFSKLYRDVAAAIDAASSDLSALQINHEDGRRKQRDLLDELQAVRSTFSGELELLEEHAEWEKLTVAFFGETNAGKSTIIESLRILLSEESRQAELSGAGQDIETYEQRLKAQASRLSSAVGAIEIEQVQARELFREAQNQQQDAFKEKLAGELANFESKQHGKFLQLAGKIHEVVEIGQEEFSARIKRRIRTACFVGIAVGLVCGISLSLLRPLF
jgi:hypothetical protein